MFFQQRTLWYCSLRLILIVVATVIRVVVGTVIRVVVGTVIVVSVVVVVIEASWAIGSYWIADQIASLIVHILIEVVGTTVAIGVIRIIQNNLLFVWNILSKVSK